MKRAYRFRRTAENEQRSLPERLVAVAVGAFDEELPGAFEDFDDVRLVGFQSRLSKSFGRCLQDAGIAPPGGPGSE